MQITLIFTCTQQREPGTGTAVDSAGIPNDISPSDVQSAVVNSLNLRKAADGNSMLKTLSTKWIVLRATEIPLKSILTVGAV